MIVTRILSHSLNDKCCMGNDEKLPVRKTNFFSFSLFIILSEEKRGNKWNTPVEVESLSFSVCRDAFTRDLILYKLL